MKRIVFILLFVFLFISCENDKSKSNLNTHCGEIIVAKEAYLHSCDNDYHLFFKEKGKATFCDVNVSHAEYEYYSKGDTIKCK